MNKKGEFSPLVIAGIVIAVLVVGAGIFMSRGKSNTSDSMAMKAEPTKVQTSPAVAGASDENVKTIDIEAGSFYYKPNVLTVKKGQKVKVVIHSVSMMHDFNIDELNVHGQKTKNGETSTVEFTPDKTGTFEYYCSVGQHRANGQVGKITVEE